MKYGIIGSRKYTRLCFVSDYITKHLVTGDVVVSGGAIGPDTVAKITADSMGFDSKIFKPEYDKYPMEIAPLMRNKQIVDYSDKIVAFWNGKSSGTLDAINYAKQQGKEVQIIYDNVKSQDGAFSNLL